MGRIVNIRTRISKSRQTIRSVTALLTSNMTSSVLSAAGGLLVARFLGPEETGAFRSYAIPLTYLTFLHLGTWDGLWRQIPYYVGKEMPEKVDEIASAGGAFNLLLSAAVSCGFIFCSAYSLAHHNLYGAVGWLSQAFCCWGVFYGGYLTSTYRTLHHFVDMAKIQVVQTILTFGMVFLLPFLKFYGLCARVAIPACLGVWLYHRNQPLRVKYRFDTKALRELIAIGLPFSFWGSLYSTFWIATESALVLYLSNVSALGLFSVAVVMRGAMETLPVAMWQVLSPRVVSTFAQDGSVGNANRRIMRVTILLTGFMAVMVVMVSFLLEICIPLLIPKYAAGIPVMKVCLWFSVIQAAFLPMSALAATGRAWLYGRSVIAGLIVFPLVTYLLYPVIGGLLSVAFGSLLGRAARTLAAYVDLLMLTRSETR
jgi:O-antigen/teichoic acid export membrane protein